jgi:hypothetical protein
MEVDEENNRVYVFLLSRGMLVLITIWATYGRKIIPLRGLPSISYPLLDSLIGNVTGLGSFYSILLLNLNLQFSLPLVVNPRYVP